MSAAAARLVRLDAADEDRGRLGDEPLRATRGGAAHGADGVHLRDLLGDGHELGHRREGAAEVVLIEPRGDDTQAAVREPVADLDDASIEELRLVDGDDVRLGEDALLEAHARRDGDGLDAHGLVADDAMWVVSIIDTRLEGLHALAREDGALEASYELFGLSTEHRAGDDLDGPDRTSRCPAHGRRQTAEERARQGETAVTTPQSAISALGAWPSRTPKCRNWEGFQRRAPLRGFEADARERRASRSASRRPVADGLSKSGVEVVQLVPCRKGHARMAAVQVVLRKLGRGSRAVVGRLVRAPRKGSVVVIEFSDGMHEYVTTPVKRVLRLAGREVFYIETVNSRYRLEVRGREVALDGAVGGS
jgi:hypothetical protein